MLDLGSWSFGKVALASVLWVALDVVLVAVYFYLKFRSQWQSTGKRRHRRGHWGQQRALGDPRPVRTSDPADGDVVAQAAVVTREAQG